LRCTAVAAEQKTEAPGLNLLKWLRENGAAQDKVELRTLEVPAAGRGYRLIYSSAGDCLRK